MMDILIVIAYLGFLMFFGLWQSFRVKDMHDFSVSSKRHGVFVVFAALSASFIGGGFSTGNASEVFKHGIGNIVALWGFSLGQILLGSLLIPHAHIPPGATSPGMLLRTAYGKRGQITAGVCALLLAAGMLGAQIAAMGAMFQVLLNVPYHWGALIGFLVVLIYSAAGGMNAIITLEVFEFALLMVGVPVLLVFSMQYAGGAEAVFHQSHAAMLHPLNGRSPVELISLFLTMMIGEMLSPSYLQRMLAGKGKKTIARATVLSGAVSIPFFVMTGLVGLCAFVSGATGDAELAMPAMILTALPVGVKGLVITAMLAIVMSSADGMLSSAAIGAVNDIILPLRRKKPDSAKLLRYARIITVLVGCVGMAAALFSGDVFAILVFSYSAWCPVLLVPMAAALLNKRASARTFTISCITGAVASLGWSVVLGSPFGLGGVVVGFVANLAVFLWLRSRETEVLPWRRQLPPRA